MLTATHFPHRLVPFLVCGSPWLISHSSGTSNILRFLPQSILHVYSYMQWPLRAFTKGFSCHPALLNCSLNREELLYSTLIFVYFLTLSPETWQSLPCLAAFWGWNLAPSLNYICISIDLLLLFRSRKFLRYFVFNILLGSSPEDPTTFIPLQVSYLIFSFNRSLGSTLNFLVLYPMANPKPYILHFFLQCVGFLLLLLFVCFLFCFFQCRPA